MNEVFGDTFYFVALLSPSDAAHLRAVALTESLSKKLVTTAWVLIELANSLAKSITRSGFVQTVRALRSDSSVVVLDPESDLFEEGIELYSARPDKDWSLTDCISFVVMQQRGIAEALTGDHHFEQAGFTALLK